MDERIVQDMFKRSRHKTSSNSTISQDSYELSERTIRANGNIYHIFKPNTFGDVKNFYQDKASMDMTLKEFKYLTSSCCDKKIYKPLTIVMTQDKYTGRYR